MVGIKLADGSFFPVLKSDSPKKIKMVISPAHKDQSHIVVELFHANLEDFQDARSIGTLRFENNSGEEDLNLVVGRNADGQLMASLDNASGDNTSIVVNPEEFPESSQFWKAGGGEEEWRVEASENGEINEAEGSGINIEADSLEELDTSDLPGIDEGIDDASAGNELDLPDMELPDLDEPLIETSGDAEAEGEAAPISDFDDSGMDFADNGLDLPEEDLGVDLDEDFSFESDSGEPVDEYSDAGGEDLDFSQAEENQEEIDLSGGFQGSLTQDLPEDVFEEPEESPEPAIIKPKKRKMNPFVFAAILVLSISALLAGSYGIYLAFKIPDTPPLYEVQE